MEAALAASELIVCFDLYQSDTGALANWNLPANTQTRARRRPGVNVNRLPTTERISSPGCAAESST